MRIVWHPFNSAHYSVEPALMCAGEPPGPPLRITTTWSVLEHPRGAVVIDTGAPPGDPDAEMPHGGDVVSRLASIGIAPRDVHYVVNTHLHVDHVGGNRALEGARFLVDGAEVDYAHAPDDPVLAAEYSLALIASEHVDYERLPDGDVDLFGDGTAVLLTTPGHAAGHRSVLLRLPSSGSILVAGDAVWMRANLAEDTLPGLLWSASAYRRSRRRLRRLAAIEHARWFFAHDPGSFGEEGWQEGGNYY